MQSRIERLLTFKPVGWVDEGNPTIISYKIIMLGLVPRHQPTGHSSSQKLDIQS